MCDRYLTGELTCEPGTSVSADWGSTLLCAALLSVRNSICAPPYWHSCHDAEHKQPASTTIFLQTSVSLNFFTMTMASENVFLSALQPNTSVTTYGLPSDIQLGNGGSVSDEVARTRRVQEQVQRRLAEKSTLPRQNGSTTQYAMSGKRQHHLFTYSHKALHCMLCFGTVFPYFYDLRQQGQMQVVL